jgi:1-acyl-sn-glycerol-3-phosphate acyltransferase
MGCKLHMVILETYPSNKDSPVHYRAHFWGWALKHVKAVFMERRNTISNAIKRSMIGTINFYNRIVCDLQKLLD